MTKNLCDYCSEAVRGSCCYFSAFIEGMHIILTNHSCKFLHLESKMCTIYKKRHEINPNCLSIEESIIMGLLPKECKYVENDLEYQKRKDTRKIKIPFNLSKYGKIQYKQINELSHEQIATYYIVRAQLCPQCKTEGVEREIYDETSNLEYFTYDCPECGYIWNTKEETKQFQTNLKNIYLSITGEKLAGTL